MKISALIVAGALSLPATFAFAQGGDAPTAAALNEGITLGEVGYGGNGCPEGTITIAISPDQHSIAMLFDAYTAEAGGVGGRPVARASCQVAIPIAVPDGVSVAIFPIDFLGYGVLPEGGSVLASVETFFAGGQNMPQTTNLTGPLAGSFVLQDPLTDGTLLWSDCGADVILRTNSNLLVRSSGDLAIASIEAAAGYRLQWRSC